MARRPRRRRCAPREDASRAPTTRPAWVPPVAEGSTIAAGSIPAARAWPIASRAAEDLARRPDRAAAADADDERPLPRPPQVERRPAGRAPPAPCAGRSSRRGPSPRASRRVAGSGRARRAAGRSGRGGRRGPPGRRRRPSAGSGSTSAGPTSPACRRPPRAPRPTRNSRLRSLFPPNASGRRSSRLIQTSIPPPSAAENRGSGWSGDGPSSSGKRGSAAIPGGTSWQHRRIVARCYAAGTADARRRARFQPAPAPCRVPLPADVPRLGRRGDAGGLRRPARAVALARGIRDPGRDDPPPATPTPRLPCPPSCPDTWCPPDRVAGGAASPCLSCSKR